MVAGSIILGIIAVMAFILAFLKYLENNKGNQKDKATKNMKWQEEKKKQEMENNRHRLGVHLRTRDANTLGFNFPAEIYLAIGLAATLFIPYVLTDSPIFLYLTICLPTGFVILYIVRRVKK